MPAVQDAISSVEMFAVILLAGSSSYLFGNSRDYLIENRKMDNLFATNTQANALLAIAAIGIFLGSYFFGRLITFIWPNNPLVRKKKDL